jgi:hypothetical protein
MKKTKKLYSFRLETHLIKELDNIDGNRTKKIEYAIQMYIQNKYKKQYNNNSNMDLTKKLENEIEYLRNTNHQLNQQLFYHSLPFYKKWFFNFNKPLLTEPKNKQ